MMSAMATIDSPQNPAVKAALGLRHRDLRLAQRLTLIDGAREALRALESDVPVQTAFVCLDLVRTAEARSVVGLLEERQHTIIHVSERVHDRLAFGNRRDGLVLVATVPRTDLGAIRFGEDPLYLVTEEVEKPGNLGAILRTADAAGCAGVIVIGGTDVFSPNVVRASIGTVFSVPIATATAEEAIAWLRAAGIRAVSAHVDGPTTYTRSDLTGPLAIVLGSESDGLSPAWTDAGHDSVSIPMRGTADSLNVAAAAAILAFEARRQRDVAGGQPNRGVG